MKRSAELGASLWHSAFAANLASALACQGLLVFDKHWQPVSLWWQPCMLTALFLSGQAFTLYSLQRGDVSIATPVLGLKIILVAVFTTLLVSRGLGWHLWLAAALSTAGIASLNHPGAHRTGTRAAATIVSAGLAAISFALFDVLLQKWTPVWGMGLFLPLAIGLAGLLSCAMIAWFPTPLRSLPPATLRWLACGASLFALQAMAFASAVAYFGEATASNVVYSSRGLWSVVAVAFIGRWFHSSEKHLDASVLRWRFAGAALMFTAILLVLV